MKEKELEKNNLDWVDQLSQEEWDKIFGIQDTGEQNGPSPAQLEEFKNLMQQIDPQDAEQAYQDLLAYAHGEKTWAQIQGIPQAMMAQIAEQAYLKFQSGRLEEAETLFYGLTVWDDKTAYYHVALGAIYQRQKKFLDALAEYTTALELDENDITAYVNRGEVYHMIGYGHLSIADYDAAIARDPKNRDPWGRRARFLKSKYEQTQAKK